MPGYRLYLLDDRGHIIDRHDLNCPNDRAAMLRAAQLVNTHSAELWLLDKRVASFKARSQPYQLDRLRP
jgi:hypothetical protein